MELDIDLSKYKFCFAVPAYDGKVELEFANSLIAATNHLTQMGVPWCMISLRNCALIDSARNQLIHRFLNETDADILVFLDCDMSWSWESMERLLAWSTLYPSVAGVYCGRKDPPNFVVHVDKPELNEHGLLPISGAGFGFTALHRDLLEQLEVPSYADPNYENPLKQFTAVGIVDGEYIGEDIYFFKLIQKHGFQTYADPGIELNHHGSKTYSYQFKDIINSILGEYNGFQKH